MADENVAAVATTESSAPSASATPVESSPSPAYVVPPEYQASAPSAASAPTAPTGDAANASQPEQAPEQPSPFAFNDQQRAMAQERYGLRPEQLNAFGDVIQFDRFYGAVANEIVGRLQQEGWTPPNANGVAPAQSNGNGRQTAQPQQSPNGEWLYPMATKPEDYADETFFKDFAGLNQHYGGKIGAMAQEISTLKQALEGVTGQFGELQDQRYYDQFARWKSEQKGVYDDVFGTAHPQDLDGRTREGRAVREVIGYAKQMISICKANRMPVPHDVISRAVSALHQDKAKALAAKSVSEQANRRTMTNRPNVSPPPKKLTLDEQREEFARRATALMAQGT